MPVVLIVDDVQLFSDVVGGALRRAGYEVLDARNGREAVDVVRRRRPSLVLLDLAMPVMGGIEALRIIRADPDSEVSATPVLVVSASSDHARLTEATRLGARGHMLKSRFSLWELVDAVRELVPPEPSPEPEQCR
jgi:CheY-like chemotaxis protein